MYRSTKENTSKVDENPLPQAIMDIINKACNKITENEPMASETSKTGNKSTEDSSDKFDESNVPPHIMEIIHNACKKSAEKGLHSLDAPTVDDKQIFPKPTTFIPASHQNKLGTSSSKMFVTPQPNVSTNKYDQKSGTTNINSYASFQKKKSVPRKKLFNTPESKLNGRLYEVNNRTCDSNDVQLPQCVLDMIKKASGKPVDKPEENISDVSDIVKADITDKDTSVLTSADVKPVSHQQNTMSISDVSNIKSTVSTETKSFTEKKSSPQRKVLSPSDDLDLPISTLNNSNSLDQSIESSESDGLKEFIQLEEQLKTPKLRNRNRRKLESTDILMCYLKTANDQIKHWEKVKRQIMNLLSENDENEMKDKENTPKKLSKKFNERSKKDLRVDILKKSALSRKNVHQGTPITLKKTAGQQYQTLMMNTPKK